MEEPVFEIQTLEKKDNYAKLAITPLIAGYGHTIGNALRRVLYSSLSGAAITTVKIAGVNHQFTTLKGVKEDMLDFILNLKKVRFEYTDTKTAKVKLSVKEAGEVKAGDLQCPAGLKVANPDLVLAHVAKGGKLEADMQVEVGVGYSPAEEREKEGIGIIPVDANFSPIERVRFSVEETRVGRVTNYDKLILEIWTDGTIKPKQALVESAKILQSYFAQIINPKEVLNKEEEEDTEDSLGPVGKLSVEEIGLPTRVSNALAKSGYDTVEKLVKASKEDLAKVRNLGEKSIKIIKAALAEKGVDFNA